jgi:hypothetical protein
VAKNNTIFRLKDVKELTYAAFGKITKDVWTKAEEHDYYYSGSQQFQQNRTATCHFKSLTTKRPQHMPINPDPDSTGTKMWLDLTC